MSGEFTIGVEEEYQLVDPENGALKSCAPEVLAADWSDDLQAEMMMTAVEVGTPICASFEEVRAQIGRLRTQAATAAASRGLQIVAAGLHPDDDFEAQEITRGDRYARLQQRLGRLARTDHIFGMHIHVAIPERMDRVALLARVRAYLPHLIALSASSPIYARTDTCFASYRTVLAGRLPSGGIPPALESTREFERFMAMSLAAGLLQDESSLYWSLRPHSRYPTLEFRAGDVCPSAEEAAAIAAFVRAVVVGVADGLETPLDALPAGTADAVLRANEWQAARYGMDARIVSGGMADTMRGALLRLVEEVQPYVGAGDGAALAVVTRIAERGNAAERIRARHRTGVSLPAMVSWLAGETLLGTGMDRRAEQRLAGGA